ncbi:la protein homolog [Chironomus tepperi]|uniref:la protein homolog n=1 Tax=Chironomus tepperi TaxID=113505 RepID=UPI00391EF732
MADTENVAPEVTVEDKEVEVKEVNTENGSSQETPKNATKLEGDIIRQIEYYFGECNLNRDKFLRGKINDDKDGWVPISVLLTFNRLKAITEDAKLIAEALEKSTSGLVQISEDKEKLRRHPDNPLPEFNETRRKELSRRTAYAKGFPLDSKMDTLVGYFNSNFQKVENVVMRKYYDSKTKVYKFKGSVFILFEKREQAEEFVKKEGLKYGEKELLRYMQEEYFEVKKKEKSKKDEKKKAKKAEQQAEKNDDIVLPKNAVVHFTGIEGSISREDIRKRVLEINPALTIAFIHFERGDKKGELRFSKENDGKEFIEKLEGAKMKLNDLELSLSLLEGEEEEKFLATALEDMKKARQRINQKNKGRGRFNKFNDRKRKNDDRDNDEEVAPKHAREDNEAVTVVASE